MAEDQLVTVAGASLVVGPTAEDVAEFRRLSHGCAVLIYRRCTEDLGGGSDD